MVPESLEAPNARSIYDLSQRVAEYMKSVRLVMTTWHDNKTFVEGFDIDWKLLRILHLRVRPDVNSMVGTKMFGNLRRVAEFSKLDAGKLQ